MRLLIVSSLAAVLGGCASAAPPSEVVPGRQMTVGLVQREVREGMSQAEVAEALGSPNIVTRDAEGHEVWVYDRIASEVRSSHRSGYATLLILGGGSESASVTRSSRTLTVVIRFNEQQAVSSFSWHASSF